MKACVNRRSFLLNSVGAILMGATPLKTYAVHYSPTIALKPFIKCGRIHQINLREFYHRADTTK